MKIKFVQAAGLGDLLFLEPIARYFYLQGDQIYWPVVPMFQSISKYIPYINWRESQDMVYDEIYKFDGLKPAEYNCRILEAKYKYADFPFYIWRTFHYNRFMNKEATLVKRLKIDLEKPYRLIHSEYDSNRLFTIPIPENPDMRNIYIEPIQKFSLFDWSTIIENAYEIHVVSTSSLYLIEKLNLIHNPIVNLYGRHNDPDLNETKFLLTKPCKLISHPGLLEKT